jgi:hypothetical protein
MTSITPRKVVYLFGAGATHAEIKNLDVDSNDERCGLLIRHVSSRVIQAVKRNAKYLAGVETVTGTTGSLNIELLISLLENSKIFGWRDKTALLIKHVERDITHILSPQLTRKFYLHKALFEYHKHRKTRQKETVLGLISLNYDDVVGSAFESIMQKRPEYCLQLRLRRASLEKSSVPLLQLHGSFRWRNRTIGQRKRPIEIIPIGSSKSYTHVPYGHIWNRALELLIECDCLRVIGCSLSANDAHLIDLLFKAHLQRKDAIEIEIIDKTVVAERIRDNYGFFPRIRTLSDLADQTIPDPNPLNPFGTWLRYQSIAILGKATARRMRFIRQVVK